MLVRPLHTKARQALMSCTNVDWEEMKNGPLAQVVPLPVPVPGVESGLLNLHAGALAIRSPVIFLSFYA